MPDALQKMPPAIRAGLEAITAKLPTGWTVVEVIHDHYGWTVWLPDEKGYTGAEIPLFDPPAKGAPHQPPGENDRI